MGFEPIVYVVDDDASIRRSLRRLIEHVGLTVKDFADGPAFLRDVTTASRGCLVLDLRMPQMSGLELQRELKLRQIEMPVIFLSAHGDIGTSVQAMKAGATDFLEKPFNEHNFLDVIQNSIQLDLQARDARTRREEVLEHVALLTPRERGVFELVVVGKMNKEIANELGIAEATVKAHRGKVMEKMGADSVPELVVLAQVAGVIATKE
jgi:two-component system, LuxR family, response regulator FixJ